MRVCIYGSASKTTPQRYMDEARKLGELVAQGGHVNVNGGGKTGCMGAANEGTRARGGKIVSVIHETFLVDKEEFVDVDEMIVATGDGLAERKRLLVDGCDCIIALPGGAGTFDELWESVAEVGLGFRNIPIVLVNVDGYYDPFHVMITRANKDTLMHKPPEQLLSFEPDAERALATAMRRHREINEAQAKGSGMPERRGKHTKKTSLWSMISPSNVWGQDFVSGCLVGALGAAALSHLLSNRCIWKEALKRG